MYNIVVLYSLIKSSYECLFNRLFCCKKYKLLIHKFFSFISIIIIIINYI